MSFDDSTEYLTEKGFKSISNWDYEDQIAYYDLKSNSFKFGFPEKHITLHPQGAGFEMLHLKNSVLDVLVSEEYKCLYHVKGEIAWTTGNVKELPKSFEIVTCVEGLKPSILTVAEYSRKLVKHEKIIYAFEIENGIALLRRKGKMFVI